MTKKYSPILIILALLALSLAACSDSGGSDGQAAAQTASSDRAPFDREMRKQGCEILTAELVAATFDVPADALRQLKIMGCRYSWDSGDGEVLEAGITMLQVYDDAARAADWFASATRSRTAEEMKAEMDKVAGRLEESEQLDTDAKKSAAKGLLDAVGSKAVTFEDVNGVGDEARVSDEGTVYVRVGNLTFMVSAYNGPEAPPPDFEGVDLQQMAQIAKESAAQWAVESAPQRKADGIRLAGAIAESL